MLNLSAGGVVAKAANRFFFTGHGVLFQSPCGLGVGSVLLRDHFQRWFRVAQNVARTDDSDHEKDSNLCPDFLVFLWR